MQDLILFSCSSAKWLIMTCDFFLFRTLCWFPVLVAERVSYLDGWYFTGQSCWGAWCIIRALWWDTCQQYLRDSWLQNNLRTGYCIWNQAYWSCCGWSFYWICHCPRQQHETFMLIAQSILSSPFFPSPNYSFVDFSVLFKTIWKYTVMKPFCKRFMRYAAISSMGIFRHNLHEFQVLGISEIVSLEVYPPATDVMICYRTFCPRFSFGGIWCYFSEVSLC